MKRQQEKPKPKVGKHPPGLPKFLALAGKVKGAPRDLSLREGFSRSVAQQELTPF